MKSNIRPSLRNRVLSRDNNRCRWCGFANSTRQLEADHIVPESKGGETTLENLQCLCSACNKIKGTVQLDPMAIQPPTSGFGDFDTIESLRDELETIVASVKIDIQSDLLSLAQKWRQSGTRKLTIRKRLNKLTTSGKVQEIIKII
jgi:hypothetical protein